MSCRERESDSAAICWRGWTASRSRSTPLRERVEIPFLFLALLIEESRGQAAAPRLDPASGGASLHLRLAVQRARVDLARAHRCWPFTPKAEVLDHTDGLARPDSAVGNRTVQPRPRHGRNSYRHPSEDSGRFNRDPDPDARDFLLAVLRANGGNVKRTRRWR